MVKKVGIRGTLIKIFQENKNKKLSLEQIYSLFSKQYKITRFMKKTAPSEVNRPRYHNYVRSTLYKLVNEGIIKKHSHNCYYYSKKNP